MSNAAWLFDDLNMGDTAEYQRLPSDGDEDEVLGTAALLTCYKTIQLTDNNLALCFDCLFYDVTFNPLMCLL